MHPTVLRAVITVATFLMALSANAQVLVVEQTNFYGGSGFEDFWRVVETNDGGFLALGRTNSADGHFASSTLPTTVDGNAFVAKFDSLGALSWAHTYGGSWYDGAHAAAQTADGGYVVLCTTSSYDGQVTGRVDTSGLEGSSDMWMLRLDAGGALLWTQTFGSNQNDYATDVTATTDGGYLILGYSHGSDGDVAFHYGDFFDGDWFLVKTDSSGNRQWRRVLGGTGHESYGGTRLFTAPMGGYYIVGQSISHDYDITADNVWPGGVVPTDGPVFLKLDDTGAVEWCKRYGGTGDHGMWNAVYSAADTTLYAVGFSKANNNYFTGNHPLFEGPPSKDMYLVKVDGQGELKLARIYGTGVDEEGRSIGLNTMGECLVAGTAFPPLPAPPGYYGNIDTRMFTTNHAGDSLSTKLLGGSHHDTPIGVFWRNGRWLIFGNAFSPGFADGNTGLPATPGISLFVTTLWQWPLSVQSPANMRDMPDIQVAPNPSGARDVTCHTPASWAGRPLRVLNTEGKTVYKTTVHKRGQTTLPVSGWQPGVYLVTVEAKEGRHAVKLIIQ